ncbi:MAG: reverse transcriptase family protein [Bacteroidia bacterium]|nr:reverse transcriptase family protein [Bacteroidia bacterium]
MNQKTKARQLKLRKAFLGIRHVNDLCRLLKIDKRRLMLVKSQPRYKAFSIPKKGGGERHIETPSPALKKIQSALNRFLQAVYYFEKSAASYGFIVGVKNEDDRRNVVTNARKHIGNPYLLNVDIKDFFHAVKKKDVMDMFLGEPFGFQTELASILTQLTIYKGRLPMGAPTSPVLSNMACRQLDEVLVELSTKNKWTYTRYADDMSFSGKEEFGEIQVNLIRHIIQEQRFKVNEKKVKHFGPEDPKIVTGLLVSKRVELAPGYIETLEKDIEALEKVMLAQNFQGEIDSKWVDQMKIQIRGRLNFAGFVMGKRKQKYLELKDKYYGAINPPEEDFGAVSWRSFPYNI